MILLYLGFTLLWTVLTCYHAIKAYRLISTCQGSTADTVVTLWSLAMTMILITQFPTLAD